jgi:hypothetical protein
MFSMGAPAPKQRSTRGSAAAPKRARPTSGKRKVARVSEGAAGALAVLANDPEFQRKVAAAIERGPQLRAAIKRAEANVRRIAEKIDEMRAEEDAKRRKEGGQPSPAQMKAREALYQQMVAHGRAPTDDEIAEALGSWH